VIESLALAFEREDIRIPNDPVMVGELVAYHLDYARRSLLQRGAGIRSSLWKAAEIRVDSALLL
jgi:hypothetical protein